MNKTKEENKKMNINKYKKTKITLIIIFVLIFMLQTKIMAASMLNFKLVTTKEEYSMNDKIDVTVDWTEKMEAGSFTLMYDSKMLKFLNADIDGANYDATNSGEISVNWLYTDCKDTANNQSRSKLTFYFEPLKEGIAHVEIKEVREFGVEQNGIIQNDFEFDFKQAKKDIKVSNSQDGGNQDGGNPDGGNQDGGNPDGGNPDGGNQDGGNPDGGNPDGGNQDGGNQDGGNQDGGNPDGGNPDGGNQDGGNPDGGNQDGGNPDGGNPDGGNQDGGNPDGGNQDGGNQDGGNQDGENQDGGNHGGDTQGGGTSNTNNEVDNTISNGQMPQTGIDIRTTIIGLISIMIIGCVAFVKYKNMPKF